MTYSYSSGDIGYSINMYFRTFFCICIVLPIVYGKTEEEIKAWFIRQAMECNKDHPVTPEELVTLQSHKLPDSKNAKCLLACVFRQANFLDSKGMFDEASASAQAEKDHAGSDDKVVNAKKLMGICTKVNTEEVSDGEAGCDRAMLLFKCFHENGPGLGFTMHPV